MGLSQAWQVSYTKLTEGFQAGIISRTRTITVKLIQLFAKHLCFTNFVYEMVESISGDIEWQNKLKANNRLD
jgi:hypothetical protein